MSSKVSNRYYQLKKNIKHSYKMKKQYKIETECVKEYTYPLIFFQVKQSFHLI